MTAQAQISRAAPIVGAFVIGLVLVLGLIVYLTGGSALPAGPAIAGVGGPFHLEDQNGKAFSDADMKGRPYLVFFGFTHCPDICPTTLFDISQVMAKLGKDADRTGAVFITVDPERDTPALMKDYLSNFDPHLRGLTGDRQSIDAAVAIRVQEPVFESQTKTKLGSSDVGPGGPSIKEFIGKFMQQNLDTYLHKNPETAATIRRKIEERAESLLDPHVPWTTAEALIELGATLCSPKPRCEDCPLSRGCIAFQEGKAESLPIKNGERTSTDLFRSVLVIENEGWVLVKKGERGKVMADLYEFPYFERSGDIREMARSLVGEVSSFIRRLTERNHTFTRYKAHLSPYFLSSPNRPQISGCEWVPISRLSDFPFSSGHRKIKGEVVLIYENISGN